MPHLKHNDVELYYDCQGTGEPVVLVNGMTAPGSAWKKVAEHLLRLKYQVITFDNRGTGKSTIPQPGYDVDDMAEDIIALLDYLNIKKAHFIGHAFGGCMVQSIAYHYLARVNTVVIGSSFAKLAAPFRRYCESRYELTQFNVPQESLIKLMIPWSFGETYLEQQENYDELVKKQLNNTTPQSAQGYLGQFMAMCRFDSTGWVDKINCNALVLVGAEDIISLPHDNKALANKIPNAQFKIISKAGHNPAYENKEEYLNVISQFLNSIK